MRPALLLSVACLALAAGESEAQVQRCGERAAILRELASRYREQPVAIGIVDNSSGVLEILAADDGSTWTAIITRTNGVSCVVMSGEHWQGRLQGRGA